LGKITETSNLKKNPMSYPNRQQRINILLLVFSAVICFSFAATDPIKSKQYQLIFHQFLDSETDAASLRIATYESGNHLSTQKLSHFEPSFYPDTLTFFKDSSGIGESISPSNGRYLIRSIESSYYGSPGFVYRYTRDLFGFDYPQDAFVAAFKREIGVSPFTQTLLTAKKEAWHFWSGEAVLKTFYKYYGGPSNQFQQVTYGFIYRVAAKKYMTDYVKLLNHILLTKQQTWLQLCNAYKQHALTDSTFEGSTASYLATKELFTQEELQSLSVLPVNYLYIPIGELMRRQIDGSLPAIIECIGKILKDYDPENYAALKVK
jgi:hypothetical protein